MSTCVCGAIWTFKNFFNRIAIGENLWLNITLFVQRNSGPCHCIIKLRLVFSLKQLLIMTYVVLNLKGDLRQLLKHSLDSMKPFRTDSVIDEHVTCLQRAEFVNSMKDVMDFSREHKVGAIESLNNYPPHAYAAKLQMQKMKKMSC